MKRKIWCFTRIAVILVLVGCLSGSIIHKNYGADLDEEKKKQEEIQKELKNTQAFLKKLENLKGDTEAYIKTLDERMNELNDSIYNIEQSIEVKKAAIEETKLAIIEAQKEIDVQYESMKLRIQYMYENGENSYMSLIFDSKNIVDFIDKAEYLAQITAYDREQLEKFEVSKQNLNAQEQKLIAEEADLEKSITEMKEEVEATENLIAAKRELISGYSSEISGAQSEIAQIKSDLETQKAIVAELEEIERKRREEQLKNNLNKVSYDGGNMTWPLPGRTYLSSYFGTRPNPFGKPTQEFHSGIDIPAPRGTQIVAAYSGQIAWSYYSNSAGNWVGIDHGDGIITVYMHMSKRLVNEGDWVEKGQVIGLVGSTGRSTGNHLHFSVRKNGTYVDPLQWVTP